MPKGEGGLMDKNAVNLYGEQIIKQLVEKARVVGGLLDLEITDNPAAEYILQEFSEWGFKVGCLVGCYENWSDEKSIEEYKKMFRAS